MSIFGHTLRPLDMFVAGAAFIMVLALWIALITMLQIRRRTVEAKLVSRLGFQGASTAGRRVLTLWHDGEETTTLVPSAIRRLSLFAQLERIPIDAGLSMPLPTLALTAAGITALAFVCTMAIVHHLLAGLAAAAAAVMVMYVYVTRRINKRLTTFEQQFVDALDLASRSLRAGHPLLGAFTLVADEIGAPVGPIFAGICQEQAMGVSLEEALRRSATNHKSADLKLFSTSVAIQLRSGGNLADMVDRLAFVIRDRMRLRRRVRVLTAQTQFSKNVLMALPFILFTALSILNPHYLEPLYNTRSGQLMLGGAGIGLLLGAWMMNRMAVLRF